MLDGLPTGCALRPARPHLLLLRAALLPRSAAHQAWSEWRAITDLDRLDYGSLQLLPRAFWNLGGEVGDDDFGRWARGIARACWLKGQSLQVGARLVIERLRAAGVPLMIGKGAAVARYHPREFSARPMFDLDLTVPEERRAEAWSLFEACGFVPYAEQSADSWEVLERTSWNFHGPGGAELDLHWRALPGVPHLAADALVWNAARPIEFAGLELLAPAPRHLIFQTLLHVAEWDPAPRPMWAADLAAVIGEPIGSAFEWSLLVRDARSLRIERLVHAGIGFMAEELGLQVPAGVLRSLGRGAGWQRRELLALARKPTERGPAERRAIETGRRIRSHAPPGARVSLVSLLDLRTANRARLRWPALLPFWAAFVALGRPAWLRRPAELLRRGDPVEATAPPLRLEFGHGRSAERFLGDGWEGGIEHGRWTRGCDARLALRLPREWEPTDLELEADMVVGLWPDSPRRNVELWVNGRRRARWRFEGEALLAARQRIRIPRRLLRKRRLSLLFHIPDPYVPNSQFGHAKVPRAFGVHLGWIVLEPCGS